MAKTPPLPLHDPSSATDYWVLSRQPLVSLVFVVPILAIYEAGVLSLGPKAVRNGVDVWLRGFLELLDFGNYFLLPVLVVGLLLGWHHTTRKPWRVPRGVFWGMAVECVVLAFCLRLISHVEAFALSALFGSALGAAKAAALAAGASTKMAGLIAFLGAGVYEELLFRLVLFCAIAWAIRRAGMVGTTGTATAVLATSALFAAAHYVGPYGEAIVWRDFGFWYGAVFRFLAGVFFSVLFVARGFGIAAGSHAGYDILVKLAC
jgi:membrane protease YdiL (CAAX protease family)